MKSRQQPKQWTIEQKNYMIGDCIESSKVLSSFDKTKANTICSCAIEKLINKYTYDQIWKIDEQAKGNKVKIASLIEPLKPLMQECADPYLIELNIHNEIIDCVNGATKNNKMTKEQANNYCTCFVTYLHDKYPADQLPSFDSIMKTEMNKLKECIDNAMK